jgi:hypothetical protein
MYVSMYVCSIARALMLSHGPVLCMRMCVWVCVCVYVYMYVCMMHACLFGDGNVCIKMCCVVDMGVLGVYACR